jgi:hypothetical protein
MRKTMGLSSPVAAGNVHFGPYRRAVFLEEGELLRHVGDDGRKLKHTPVKCHAGRLFFVAVGLRFFRLHEFPQLVS